jgi:hypothetical protein
MEEIISYPSSSSSSGGGLPLYLNKYVIYGVLGAAAILAYLWELKKQGGSLFSSNSIDANGQLISSSITSSNNNILTTNYTPSNLAAQMDYISTTLNGLESSISAMGSAPSESPVASSPISTSPASTSPQIYYSGASQSPSQQGGVSIPPSSSTNYIPYPGQAPVSSTGSIPPDPNPGNDKWDPQNQMWIPNYIPPNSIYDPSSGQYKPPSGWGHQAGYVTPGGGALPI